jgi:hypothetical protein
VLSQAMASSALAVRYVLNSGATADIAGGPGRPTTDSCTPGFIFTSFIEEDAGTGATIPDHWRVLQWRTEIGLRSNATPLAPPPSAQKLTEER